MREKVIAYSIVCCFVFGVLYLKNKVFNKKIDLSEEKVEEEKTQ